MKEPSSEQKYISEKQCGNSYDGGCQYTCLQLFSAAEDALAGSRTERDQAGDKREKHRCRNIGAGKQKEKRIEAEQGCRLENASSLLSAKTVADRGKQGDKQYGNGVSESDMLVIRK